MIVHTERTPNPRTMKFVPGRVVSESTFHHSADTAQGHPFLEEIFALGNIERVFIGIDFVSVTLAEGDDWDGEDARREAIIEIIGRHVESIASVPDDGAEVKENEDDPTVARIKSILETHVRPAVASDGGDVVFQSFQNGTLYLHMRGACSGCPSSAATLRIGVLNLMRHFVPEVEDVQEVA